jgi:hypothetical protein
MSASLPHIGPEQTTSSARIYWMGITNPRNDSARDVDWAAPD